MYASTIAWRRTPLKVHKMQNNNQNMVKNSGVEADFCQLQAVGVMLKLITQHAMQIYYFIARVFE